ncbi:ABC transporter permease [Rathayibacter tanaceti]|uniref:ABC transporter permease n=2 Tax=Rathayibacter tanaceti TaxID=1671680 RepID=A0A166H7T4_9MICO|nr:ABC transporter permease [Rathayibacter tanaceti]KZX20104.1 ABC-2 family transporter protein [Rathayibacter tanaceti]QHC56472.1 ABC transporter permease [Rathayibacter tanaceti]TCO36677.1 ABC-2 type transport system permease protein [Rathayibacter tanaceti]
MTDRSTATAPRRSALDGVRLRPGGVVASEVLKLVTVRSTWWSIGVAVVLSLGLAAILASDIAGEPIAELATARAVRASSVHLQVIGLVIAVLGALSIGGEYATGMIRSTYTAVPRRLPSLLARAGVVAGAAFLVGTVTTAGSFTLISSGLASRGAAPVLDGEVFGALLGGAFYLAVVGAFSVGIGALLRSSAAAIGISVGVLFVLPVVAALAGALLRAQWVADASPYLLSRLGGTLSDLPDDSGIGLAAAVAGALGWALVALVPALVATRVRDV